MTYETPTGANMFAYCLNNPVSMADNGGEAAHIVIGAAIGAVTNVAFSYVTSVLSGEEYEDKDLVVDLIAGAAGGALAASGIPVSGQQVLAGTINATATVIKEGKFNIVNVGIAFASGFAAGKLGGDGLCANTKVAKQIDIIDSNFHAVLTKGTARNAIKTSFGRIKGEVSKTFRNFIGGTLLANAISNNA